MNGNSFLKMRGVWMDYQTITLEKSERYAILSLNRPTAMNSMNTMMIKELAECFEALHHETDIQVLVIRGQGKVFSAGGDIKEMLNPDIPMNIAEVMPYLTRLSKAFYTLPMITVAAVHGAAAGLGFSLVLGSDIIIAEETSKLAMNFIGIGLIPDGGGHFFIKERVGTVKAKQIIWEGKVLNGPEALALGLIDYSVQEGVTEVVVNQVVDKLLASPVAAMLETKAILHAQKVPELEAILAAEEKGQTEMRGTQDHIEGIKAFVEKRKPAFIGQ